MRSLRSVSILAFTLVAIATPFLFLGPACSSQAAPVEQGGACEVVTDCAGGLICAPTTKGASMCPCICTSNLSGVQQLPPTPDAGTAAVAQGDAAGGNEAATSDAAAGGSDDAATATQDSPSSTPVDAAAE